MIQIQPYLVLDLNDILEGIVTHQEPRNDDDILINKIGGEFYHVVRNGVKIVKTLNKIIKEHGYKILCHSNRKEAEQIKNLETLKAACSLKKLEFPEIFAMAVCDEEKYKGVTAADPIIFTDCPHGICVAAYAKGKSGKSGARTALSKLLSISEESKGRSYVLDSDLLVVLKAKSEGWHAIQIGEDETSSFFEVIQKISLNLSFSILPPIKLDGIEKNSKVSVKDIGSSPRVIKSNSISQEVPFWESEIILRAEDEFENTGLPRIGGSSWSSGVFKEIKTGKLWLGKADTPVLKVAQARAYKEKVALDFYAYFGISIPRIELSLQHGTNTGLPDSEEEVSVHLMSELIPDLKTIGSGHHQFLDPFSAALPNPNREITVKLEDGTKRKIAERGLGHILAVARLINDVDVIGGGGGNIGYIIEKDAEGREYARSFKIDAGEAFSQPEIMKPCEKRTICVAAAGFAYNCVLEFDLLPEGTQEEFLLTLHRIVETDEERFRSLIDKKGARSFISFMKLTVDKLLTQILESKLEMMAEYKKDLEKTRPLYELHKSKICNIP